MRLNMRGHHVVLLLAILAVAPRVAVGQGSGAPVIVATPPSPTPPPAAPPVVAAPLPSASTDAAYISSMRAQCSTEIEKDASWRADITNRFETLAHQKAAAAIVRNERHVFIAYAVIWILVAGFVAMMWMRQQRLSAEIVRLADALQRVEADDRTVSDKSKPRDNA
jgi:CcmD family protein